jgi:mitochondrial fission protein ELM1
VAAARNPARKLSIWVVSDGKAGMENQCLGLADALGGQTEVKRIALRAPWRQATPYLPGVLTFGLARRSDRLSPPWPDLLITSGRQAAGIALSVRRRSRGRTFCVHIQNPGVSPHLLDLVVMPRHDRKLGANVISTRGALHRVTAARLAEDAARLTPALSFLPHPRVAVLIGGSNDVYRLSPTVMGDVAERLANLAKQRGIGLMVTPSRRTGSDNEAILRARLSGLPAVIWDGRGENPYFGYLGLADAVVCTCDSVSMLSEAASTGKPVYIIELEGGSPKFRRFHESLYADGVARPFTGELDSWTYEPLDDTARVAAEVLRRMATHRADTGTVQSRSG